MVALPNREDKLYSRLWCVYEMFVASSLGVHVELAHSFAKVGSSGCRHAVCSNPEDRQRICGEIEAWGNQISGNADQGYSYVDASIRALTRAAKVSYVVLMLCALCIWLLYSLWLEYTDFHVGLKLFIVGRVPVVWQQCFAFYWLKRGSGKLSWCCFVLLTSPIAAVGMICVLLGSKVGQDTIRQPLFQFGESSLTMSASSIFVLSALHCTPRRWRHGIRRFGPFCLVFLLGLGGQLLALSLRRYHFVCYALRSKYLPLLLAHLSVHPLLLACWWLWLVSWGVEATIWYKASSRNSDDKRREGLSTIIGVITAAESKTNQDQLTVPHFASGRPQSQRAQTPRMPVDL